VSRSQTRWLFVVVGVLLWVLVVYPAYYVVHKPLSTASLHALANVAVDLLTWLAMLAVATALGSRLTRRLAYRSLLERLTFSAGLGLALFSLLVLALGLVGLLYRWLFWLLLASSGLALWREFLALGRALHPTTWPRPHGAWHWFLSLFIAATLLLALATTLVPPTEWDSLVYHLTGPERYLQAHQLTFDFDNYYLFFPSFTEMLFTAGMALKSDVVARLLHFGYLLLTLGALGALATRYWERKLGLWAAALFVSIPTAVQVATWSYVDLALTFYNLAAVCALLNWLYPATPRGDRYQGSDPLPEQAPASSSNATGSAAGRRSVGWLLLAGIFAGAALSIKYQGVATLLVLGAILLWALVRSRISVRQFLSGGLLLGGVAVAVAAPWYIKNALIAGNPLYPLVWGGREWNEVATRWLLVPGQKMSILDLVVVPWTLTVFGKQGTVAYDATYSPLFLTLLPLLLIVRRQARGVGELLLAALVGYGFWLVSGAAAYGTFILRGRQVLPIFAPLSLLCAYGLDGLQIWDRKSFSLQRVLMVLAGLTLAFGLLGQMLLTVGLNPWPYLTGQQTRDDYLDQYTSQRLNQAIRYINENLSGEDRVLFVWEPRSYGTQVPHDADVLLDNFAQRLARYGSPEGIAAGLGNEGFTHLLVNRFVYPWITSDFPITAEEQSAWEEFSDRYLTDENLVHAEQDYLMLYRLPPEGGP
jgi:4-amino-4-deoxy-L-arabinose transferase-like glycosyltransferase